MMRRERSWAFTAPWYCMQGTAIAESENLHDPLDKQVVVFDPAKLLGE